MILCSFPDLLQAIRPWFFEVRNQRQGDSKKWFFLSPYVLYSPLSLISYSSGNGREYEIRDGTRYGTGFTNLPVSLFSFSIIQN